MASKLKKLIGAVGDAVDSLDKDGTQLASRELILALRKSGDALPPGAAGKLLGKLRGGRYFDVAQEVADHLIRLGNEEPVVRRQYAQALVDRGQAVAALDMLSGLVRSTRPGTKEHGEALGLIGRVYKQIYMDAGEDQTPETRSALNKAIQSYREGYFDDPQTRLWHGVNLVALLSRADRDGAPVDPGLDGKSIARQILDIITRKKGSVEYWDLATAAEASIALHDWDGAAEWIGRYSKHKKTDAFALASTLRQMREVWGIDADDSAAGQIVSLLSAKLLETEGGHLELTSKDLQLMPEGAAIKEEYFEKILGDTNVKSYNWMLKGLLRARAVARIGVAADRGAGTGFLVRGGDFYQGWGDEPLLLTNAHVVSDAPSDEALPSDEVVVTFEAEAEPGTLPKEYEVKDLLWSSPRHLHDATLLRLESTPVEPEPCPLNKTLPVKDGKQRVYVIGHPLGGGLSFSLQDNRLIDHEGPKKGQSYGAEVRKMHYRAPTEPGSSGSPVFDQSRWKVIGLHHAGGKLLKKLNGQSGSHPANEAIWIQSIRKAIAEELG